MLVFFYSHPHPPTGHVKLVDFGFAVFVGEPSAPSLRGTLEYLTPETVESDGARVPIPPGAQAMGRWGLRGQGG